MKLLRWLSLLVFSLLLVACRLGAAAPLPAPKPLAVTAMPTVEPAPEASSGSNDEAAGMEEGREFPEVTTAALADTLDNLSYSGLLPDQQITLANGAAYYEDESNGHPFVSLIDSLIATGDLNRDGAEDAAAFFVDNTTGSADFVYLVAVLSVQTTPVPLEAIMIGDRTPVKSLAVEDDQVIAEFIGPGPDDAACCPTRNMRRIFQIEDGCLVLRSSEDLGKVSLADLQGTDWHLLEMNLDKEPLMAGSSITLSVDVSQIRGATGCSTYNGRIKAGEDGLPQSIMVSPISGTQSSCTSFASQQETTYLDRLAEVIAWRYDFGSLSLTYKIGEEELGEMIYSPQEP